MKKVLIVILFLNVLLVGIYSSDSKPIDNTIFTVCLNCKDGNMIKNITLINKCSYLTCKDENINQQDQLLRSFSVRKRLSGNGYIFDLYKNTQCSTRSNAFEMTKAFTCNHGDWFEMNSFIKVKCGELEPNSTPTSVSTSTPTPFMEETSTPTSTITPTPTPFMEETSTPTSTITPTPLIEETPTSTSTPLIEEAPTLTEEEQSTPTPSPSPTPLSISESTLKPISSQEVIQTSSDFNESSGSGENNKKDSGENIATQPPPSELPSQSLSPSSSSFSSSSSSPSTTTLVTSPSSSSSSEEENQSQPVSPLPIVDSSSSSTSEGNISPTPLHKRGTPQPPFIHHSSSNDLLEINGESNGSSQTIPKYHQMTVSIFLSFFFTILIQICS
ncbi:hypothetical protein ACTA71_000362 [Dictyostelium dimigraforme]